MSEKDFGTFSKQYEASDKTVQKAAETPVEPAAPPARRGTSPESYASPVQSRRADPRVWREVLKIIEKQGGYPEILEDGSVVIRNRRPS